MSTNLFKRRDLFKITGLGILALGTSIFSYRRFFQANEYSFTGGILGANFKTGHLLRSGVDTKPTKTKTINTVIVGGGISGLSAGWWFKKNNFNDFVILEMDTEVGGNSINGENSTSKYPWGAHYVPLPSEEAKYVREFFEEIGIIQGYENGLPIYNEFHLCSDAHERLYFQGEWQDGLIPQHGIQQEDKKQYDEFFALIQELKKKKGSDGKHLFVVPLDLSSQDPNYLSLDKISMADFMLERKWTSKYLHWYVNYCCRDDYGMPHDKVSAWAGLHYFASRGGTAANADSQSVVTWPEGNGFLVSKMKEPMADHILKNNLVFSIETSKENNLIDSLDTNDKTCTRYFAKNVIFCGPRFIANKVIKGYANQLNLDYAPWLIANITLIDRPKSVGMQMSWDNVSFYSKSLGYIVANHQDLKINQRETVITYYLPLDDKNPKEERMSAYRKSYSDWLEIVIPDIEKMHPGITSLISNVDIWVWGHGMVSPGINYLWHENRKKFLEPYGSIEFAHSDMSGISVFEEAQYRGVEAAKKILIKNRHEV